MWKPESNFRRRHQKCECHEKVSGSCLALSLLSATAFFMFIAFAVENIGTDIPPPNYENSLEASPELKVKTQKHKPQPDSAAEISSDSQDSTTQAFCDMFECPSGYVINDNHVTSQCAQFPCVVDECCQMVQSNVFTTSQKIPTEAFCHMFICPDGYSLWEDVRNEQCYEYPCTVGECCVLDAVQYDVDQPEWRRYGYPAGAGNNDNNNNNNGNSWDNGWTQKWGNRRWGGGKTFPYGGDGNHYRRPKNGYYGYGNDQNNNQNNQNNNQNNNPNQGYGRWRNRNGQPASCSMFDCPDGYTRLNGDPSEMLCKGDSCIVKECCGMVQSNYKANILPVQSNYKPNILPVQSNYMANTVPEMGKSPNKAFCSMFDCPDGYVRFDGNPAQLQCSNNPCITQECCAMIESSYKAGPFCDMFACPDGFTRLLGDPSTMMCQKDPCSIGECCSMLRTYQ